MASPFLLVTDEEMLLAILKGATMDNIQITAFQNRRHCTALTCTANILVINYSLKYYDSDRFLYFLQLVTIDFIPLEEFPHVSCKKRGELEMFL